jgi:hypothetical protein
MEGWTCVYSGTQLHEAVFIKDFLEGNNITTVIMNKHDSLYLIGEIDLYVSVEDAFNANQLINKLKSE